ncbi:MAG: hypothetical protein QOH96_4113 [Blastocatellia bacterium]|jgi:hypothetical protein|nr:hypothetical protein [Blastocatellia bacterium]
MSDSKLYEGITREELNILRSVLEKQGVKVPEGDDVLVEGPYGVQLQLSYDSVDEMLTVSIAKKPFFVPESMIWSMVDEGVRPFKDA